MLFLVLIGYGSVRLRSFSSFVTGLPNTTREQINKFGVTDGNRRYIVPAEDISRDGSQVLSIEARLAIAGLEDKKKTENYLPQSR